MTPLGFAAKRDSDSEGWCRTDPDAALIERIAWGTWLVTLPYRLAGGIYPGSARPANPRRHSWEKSRRAGEGDGERDNSAFRRDEKTVETDEQRPE
jgi:hypothetical protein